VVTRGLSEVTDKRRKERGRWLPDGQWACPTEMQYYIPRPKKKKPRPEQSGPGCD
jgi:hypothetical protein